jgi:hypothetical protein
MSRIKRIVIAGLLQHFHLRSGKDNFHFHDFAEKIKIFCVSILTGIAVVIAASVMDVDVQANYTKHLPIPRSHVTSLKSSNINLNMLPVPLFDLNMQPTLQKSNTQLATVPATQNTSTAVVRTTYKPVSVAPTLFLTNVARDKIERVVMASCGELDNPLMAEANAQVILDRVTSGRFGEGINAVLNAPGQFEKPWKGGVNSIVKNAVSKVFDSGNRVTSTQIYYYINPNICEISLTKWKKDKSYVATFGRGKFIHQYWTSKT